MKTGIVGSGMIVKEFLENLQGMEGLELAAICGTPRREAYLQELCRSYGIRKWYTDYDAMVTDPGVEVVYVAVPNHLHFEFCKKAVLAGKHVICEKPFTSNSRELELESGEVCFDRLLSKNTGKCRIGEKVDLKTGDRVLQICHNDGTVKIDEVEIKEDSLQIDGVLEVSLLYLTSDDSEPVRAETEMVPFHYEAETPGITPDSVYQLNTGLEQMTAVMAGGDTVEIKGVISLDILVLQPVRNR